MDQYEYIRTAHRIYGENISEIARSTGHSRNTIRKALSGEYSGYKTREKQVYPVLDHYLEVIDKWLEEDKARPGKQRHTARRIYNRLVSECEYEGSGSTVRRYVREAKVRIGLKANCAFIPLDPQIGQEAEVDRGSALVKIRGECVQVKYLCMRSKYSGKHFLRLYPCERQQAFFDAHVYAFEFFGGVFPILIYDNLTSAVQKVLKGRDRQQQESFIKFRSYYSFEARFCNPGQGHEKGGVEGMVGFVRRNYMVPIPEGETLEEINQKVLRECLSYGGHRLSGRDRTVNEMFEEEKRHLIPLAQIRYSNVQTNTGKVDKYATVIVDKNRYSVPGKYVGFKMQVLLFVDRVEIFYGQKRLSVHERLYGNNKWSLDPDHYLELIQQRPLAFHSARPIRQWQKMWPEAMNQLLARFTEAQGDSKGIKDFITVLMLYREYQADEVQAAVELALQSNISSSEGVKHILIYTKDSACKKAPMDTWPTLPPPDLSVYNVLGGEI